jgi:hypothetical protein
MKYLIKGTRKTSGEKVQLTILARDQDHAAEQAEILGIDVAQLNQVDDPVVQTKRLHEHPRRTFMAAGTLLTVMVFIVLLVLHGWQ